jgi:AraC-like DNA-binding protein
MDETCRWLQTILGYVDGLDRPPIHFAGTASSFGNLPARFLELVFLTTGSINKLSMGPLSASIRKGQLGIFNVHFGNIAAPGERFSTWCLFLDISDDRRFDVLQKSPLAMVADVRDTERVGRAFGQVVERCRASSWTANNYRPTGQTHQRSADLPQRALLKASLMELIATLMQETTQSTGEGPSAGLSQGIGEAVALIHRRYQDPRINRLELARAASQHPDHFGRQFLKETGEPPMRYLARVRVRQACFLLQHTTQPIKTIADQTGYPDQLHFSRVFRDFIGVSPKDYRVKSQGKN